MHRCSEIAFAKCPYHDACGTRHEATFSDNSECATFNRKVESIAMTNGDRIRAMSDEELGRFLCRNMTQDCSVCPGAKYCSKGHTGLIEWLGLPAEED